MDDERENLWIAGRRGDQLQDSLNFWRWMAVASWILIGLAAALAIFPVR